MTCCIGKARIYFKSPLHYAIRFKPPNATTWTTITSGEEMSHDCEEVLLPDPEKSYRVLIKAKFKDCSTEEITEFVGDERAYKAPFYGQCQRRADAGFPVWPDSISFVVYDANGVRGAVGAFNADCSRGGRICVGGSVTIHPDDPQLPEVPKAFDFKITSKESGAIIYSAQFEECPAVDNQGCVMGEERYVDVMMGSGLPLPGVPSSITNFISDCLIAFTGFPLPPNTIEIRKITAKPLARNPFKPLKLPQKVLTLTGLPGCPAEYRIECCPDGECEPEERCPPDTDCSLDCDGLICCYKDGEVIKSFKK